MCCILRGDTFKVFGRILDFYRLSKQQPLLLGVKTPFFFLSQVAREFVC